MCPEKKWQLQGLGQKTSKTSKGPQQQTSFYYLVYIFFQKKKKIGISLSSSVGTTTHRAPPIQLQSPKFP